MNINPLKNIAKVTKVTRDLQGSVQQSLGTVQQSLGSAVETAKQAVGKNSKFQRVGDDVPTSPKLLQSFAPPVLVGHRGVPDGVAALALDPDTGLLALACIDGTVKVIGAAGVETVLEVPEPSAGVDDEPAQRFPTWLGFCDGNTLAGADRDGAVWVWDVSGGGVRTGILSPLVWQPGTVFTAFAPARAAAEGYIFAGTAAGTVHAVECSPNVSLSSYSVTAADAGFDRDPGAVVAVAANPREPSYALIGYRRGGAVLWDWERRVRRVVCLAQPSAGASTAPALTALAWHPKGKAFVGGYIDGSYALFDQKTASAPLRTLRGPAAEHPRAPISHLEWVRIVQGGDKVWVLVAAGGVEEPDGDGISLLIPVPDPTIKFVGAGNELALTAFAALCAPADRVVCAATSMACGEGAGEAPELALVALAAPCDGADAAGAEDGGPVAAGEVRMAAMSSLAPGVIVVNVTNTPAPPPSALACGAPVTAVATAPPMESAQLEELVRGAVKRGRDSSAAHIGTRGALATAPGDDASRLTELVALGHSDGTVTLWEAFAPARGGADAPPPPPSLSPKRAGSSSSGGGSSAGSLGLGGAHLEPLGRVQVLAAGAGTAVSALTFATADAGGGDVCCLLAVGFEDGTAAVLQLRAGADAAVAPPAVHVRADPPPSATSPKMAGGAAAPLSPASEARRASTDAARRMSSSSPQQPQAAPASAVVLVATRRAGGAAARVAPWWDPECGALVAVSYEDGAVVAACARTHGGHVLRAPSGGAVPPAQLAWARGAGGAGALLFALQAWRLYAFDAAGGVELLSAPIDLDLDAGAKDAPCGLFCVDGDGAVLTPPLGVPECDAGSDDGAALSDDDMPDNMQALRRQNTAPAAVALPQDGCRLVVCARTRAAVVAVGAPPAPGKSPPVKVRALNAIVPGQAARHRAAVAVAEAAAAGVCAIPRGAGTGARHCVAVVGGDGSVAAFLLPSLTTVYRGDVGAVPAQRGCMAVTACGEVLVRGGAHAVARHAFIASHGDRGGGARRFARTAAVSRFEGDGAAAGSWRDKMRGRRQNAAATRLRHLFDEAAVPPPLSPQRGASSTTASDSATPHRQTSDGASSSAAGPASPARSPSLLARASWSKKSVDSPTSTSTSSARGELFRGVLKRNSSGGDGAAPASREASAVAGVAGAHAKVSEAVMLAQLRGEKLNRMQDNTDKLQNEAADFASMAAQLNAEMDKQQNECAIC